MLSEYIYMGKKELPNVVMDPEIDIKDLINEKLVRRKYETNR